MTIFEATILGIVEGITEFLPVSSTGHLLVAQRLLGIPQTEGANAYAIVIQVGAILAVLRLYGSRLAQLVNGLTGKSLEGRKLLGCLLVAFFPAAVAGLTLDDLIEDHLFGPIPIVIAWIVGGFVILWWSRRHPRPAHGEAPEGLPLEILHWRAALAIGLFQCVALWPGTSRSFMTIMGGVAVGLSLPAAVEFSFMLGVLTLGAASGYSGLKHFASLGEVGAAPLIVGVVASFVSAYVAVKWMVDWINEKGLSVFGYWRIAAGIAVGLMVMSGWLTTSHG